MKSAENNDITSLTLIKMYVKFMRERKLSPESFKLNQSILSEVIARYYKDLDKLSCIHGSVNPDRHKRVGYLTYWITKLKPITVPDIGDGSFDELVINRVLSINELFALSISVSLLNDYYSQKRTFTPSFLEACLYLLRYRITTGSNLAIMYYYMENTTHYIQE